MSEGTSPTYLVETASTTPLKDGSVLLLVRTTAGAGRLVFPAHLAAHLFRITNPVCLATPKVTPPQHRRAGVTPERRAAYETIERESAADPRVWGAVGRACRRHGIEPKAFFAWRHNRRARARAAEQREPIAKPSGRLL